MGPRQFYDDEFVCEAYTATKNRRSKRASGKSPKSTGPTSIPNNLKTSGKASNVKTPTVSSKYNKSTNMVNFHHSQPSLKMWDDDDFAMYEEEKASYWAQQVEEYQKICRQGKKQAQQKKESNFSQNPFQFGCLEQTDLKEPDFLENLVKLPSEQEDFEMVKLPSEQEEEEFVLVE